MHYPVKPKFPETEKSAQIPLLSFGTFQHRSFDMLRNIVSVAVERKITAFDTAPSYQNEQLLGRVVKAVTQDHCLDRADIFLATKIDGWQMQETAGDVAIHVEAALRKLGVDYLDLLLIHWPFTRYLNRTWDALVRAKARGLVRYIGLCNINCCHLERVVRSLSTVPDLIQNERHPLRTDADLLSYCRQKGIHYQAYSPLCRMHPKLLHSRALIDIAENHSKSIGQVILRWHLDTKSRPVFMSSKASRIAEYSDIYDFSLAKAEIKNIEALNEDYKIFVESWGCPE